MEIRAHLRHLRVPPRKVRLVINLVRGMKVDQAVDQLTILPKGSAQPILKLLHSAMANAEHNFKLDRHALRIKSIVANDGPSLKRFQPRAFGRAAEILKRSSHVTLILEDLDNQPRPAKESSTKPALNLPPTDIAKGPAEPKRVVRKSKSTAQASRADVHAATDKTVRRQGHE